MNYFRNVKKYTIQSATILMIITHNGSNFCFKQVGLVTPGFYQTSGFYSSRHNSTS